MQSDLLGLRMSADTSSKVDALVEHQAHRSVADLRAGYRLGKRVPNLLAEPFEELFADDLESVRRRFGLA